MNLKFYLKKLIPNSLKLKLKIYWQYKIVEKYCKDCEKNSKVKYILFSTPDHGNIGDQAIELAEEKFLHDNNIDFVEVIDNTVDYLLKRIKKIVNSNDIIMIHGGGYMGTQWIEEEFRIRKIIETFPENKIIILPQTIFYKSDKKSQEEFENSKKIYGKHKNLNIFAREKISYEIMLNAYPNNNIYLVPDIVLYFKNEKEKYNREGITFIIRNDPEKQVSSENMNYLIGQAKKVTENVKISDTVIPEKVEPQNRKKVYYKKLEEFQKAKLVITDRLHGMVFAKLTNTPCIVLSNYNYKIKGVYEWIKDIPFIYYADDEKVAAQKIEELYNYKVKKEDNITFEDEYDMLKKKLKGDL